MTTRYVRFWAPLLVSLALVGACGSDDAVDPSLPPSAVDQDAGDAAVVVDDASIPSFTDSSVDGPLLGTDDAAIDGAADGSTTDGSTYNPNVNASGCSGTQTKCGGVCVSTSVDPQNCGACGHACKAGEVCYSSGCAAGCPAGLSACNGACVDKAIDNANCGSCGTKCNPGTGCVGGACVASVTVGGAPAKCAGGGPPVVVQGTSSPPTCSGKIAAVAFRYGLCTCHDIGIPALTSDSFIDAFDSKAGPYKPGGKGGSAGANGALKNTSQFQASGDIRVSGAGGQSVGGVTTAGLELHVAGNVTLANPLNVSGDAYVGGTFSGGASATIGGALHIPACGGVPANVSKASCVGGPVTVSDPCDCKAGEIVPVASIVSYYANPAHTDNATIGLSPAVFTAPGAPARLDLPCGYYYLDRIVENAVTIAVHGPTALVVGGSIQVGSVTFTLDPGATLDVFVGGTLTASSAIKVGSVAYPAGSRFYVGGVCKAASSTCAVNGDCCSQLCTAGHCVGSGPEPKPWSVNLQSNSGLNGLFYSANGAFWTSSDLEMYGAVFAGDYHSTSNTKIHYDAAATSLADECPPPPPPGSGGGDGGTSDGSAGGADAGGTGADGGPGGGAGGCSSCRDCNNQACIGGTCGSCTDSAQCCSPLRCVSGRCIPPIK